MTRCVSGDVVFGFVPGGYQFEVGCGKCIGCRQDRCRSWSIRCTHEAQLYDRNMFVTLTYADSALCSPSLEYRDFQGFMKRLRRRVSGDKAIRETDGRKPIRFFCSGEYGGQTRRPHWHVLLFNAVFPDAQKMFNGKYRSALAEDLWQRGTVDIVGEVNPAIAAYVAGYVVDKLKDADYEDQVLDVSTGELSDLRPPLVSMSRDPGIGRWWFDRYVDDLFPVDYAVQCGKCYKVPRYYWKLFRESADGGVVEEIAERRYLKACERLEEGTPERRAVREEVARARHVLYGERGL